MDWQLSISHMASQGASAGCRALQQPHAGSTREVSTLPALSHIKGILGWRRSCCRRARGTAQIQRMLWHLPQLIAVINIVMKIRPLLCHKACIRPSDAECELSSILDDRSTPIMSACTCKQTSLSILLASFGSSKQSIAITSACCNVSEPSTKLSHNSQSVSQDSDWTEGLLLSCHAPLA